MTRHLDILDERTEMKKPFYLSLMFHVSVAVTLFAMGVWKGDESRWGDPDALGGAVGVGVVDAIPLPQASGLKNPLANDTESEAPAPEEKETRKEREEKRKEALEKLLAEDLTKPARTKKQQSEVASVNKPDENQLTNPSGERVSNPMFGGMVGSGGVGVGSSVFGDRFGAYMQAVQQRISQKWKPYEAKARNPQPVVVGFRILRDGSVEDVRVIQSSANAVLDLSAQRAVTEAAPFDPLPDAYRGGSATFEVAFRVQR